MLQSFRRKEEEKVLSRIITTTTVDTRGEQVLQRREGGTGETLVPTSLEEAPIRRQDRRTLNALKRRRTDRLKLFSWSSFSINVHGTLHLIGTSGWRCSWLPLGGRLEMVD